MFPKVSKHDFDVSDDIIVDSQETLIESSSISKNSSGVLCDRNQLFELPVQITFCAESV